MEPRLVLLRFGGIRYQNPEQSSVTLPVVVRVPIAVVSVQDGIITQIDILNPGNNYVEPVLELIEQDGKFISLTNDIGQIRSMKVLNPVVISPQTLPSA